MEEGSMTVGNSDGTNKKITWSPSICRNASILALRREKQAKLRLGWSQHGEKSLKFHSINSIVEYAKKKKKSNFYKAKIRKPLAQFIQRYNCLSMLRSTHNTSPQIRLWPVRVVAPSTSKQRKKMGAHSSVHSHCFSTFSWLNEDIFVQTNFQVHTPNSLNLQT